MQFELHLAGRAERVYEVLPSSSKTSFKAATEALQKRLNPVQREALVSAQLMRSNRMSQSMNSLKIWKICLIEVMGIVLAWMRPLKRC